MSDDIKQPSFWNNEEQEPEREVQVEDKLQTNVVKTEVNYLKQQLSYAVNAPVIDLVVRYDGRIGEIVGITPIGGQLNVQDLLGLLERATELINKSLEEQESPKESLEEK